MSAATDGRPERDKPDRLRDRAAARRERVDRWLHDRTGHRGAFDWWTNRRVPGGARWRYATGPVCLGLFAAVFATGLVMMTGYVPSANGSWASVQYMERTPGGSLVRGVHFWATHALIVAFAVHLSRLMLAAAFRSPRELAWVSGVLLVPLLAGLAVTGNPLAGSQKAFEQIEVEGAILAGTPVAGPALKRALFGGAAAGHLTLTHLYALHVALLPLAAALVGGFHLYQLLRWGTVRPGDRAAGGDPDTVTQAHAAADPDDPYVPDQLLRNAIAFAGVFAVVYYMALNHPAPLDAPPGPAAEGAPRPEWYFRFLFELRNYVPPAAEFLATGVFPAAALGLLLAVPWIDRLGARVGAAVRYTIVFGGLTAWCALTAASMSRDQDDPHYREVKAAAAVRAGRAVELATLGGVPPEGPGVLLARDPLTRGPELFREHCAACHAHAGRGAAGASEIEATDCGGANLAGFGSRAWHRGLLDPDAVDGPGYFGCTPFAGGEMSDYVQNTLWGETRRRRPRRRRGIEPQDRRRRRRPRRGGRPPRARRRPGRPRPRRRDPRPRRIELAGGGGEGTHRRRLRLHRLPQLRRRRRRLFRHPERLRLPRLARRPDREPRPRTVLRRGRRRFGKPRRRLYARLRRNRHGRGHAEPRGHPAARRLAPRRLGGPLTAACGEMTRPCGGREA